HPRSVSHAFLRAFIQRSQEFHPIIYPFTEIIMNVMKQQSKNGITDSSKLIDFSSIIPELRSKFDEIWSTYNDESQNKPKRVFCKDHSEYFLIAASGTSLLSDKLFLEMTHTFIIRSPEKSVKSMYTANEIILKKVDYRPELLKENFIKDFVGLKESKQLFDYLKESKKHPIVVDADDLINNPEKVLKEYCEMIGEEFKEKMIHWESKDIKEWESEAHKMMAQ
ncbi:12235_t:CDS:1, partial [Cetraspora pellucida]